MIHSQFRSDRGERLLDLPKDMLYGLLFGDEATRTRLLRIQRELLTLTVSRLKSEALDFMKATTEPSALGTWQVPRGAANEMPTNHVVLEVVHGEIRGTSRGRHRVGPGADQQLADQ